MTNRPILNALARSFVAGDATVDGIVDRASRTLGRKLRALRGVAARYLERFKSDARPRRRDVLNFLLNDAGFRRAWVRHSSRLRVEEWIPAPDRMRPMRAAAGWNIPAIETVGALAEWLGLSVGELRWFADLKGLGSKQADARLSHYRYRVLAKSSGSLRLIEAPKDRLKQIQRQILSGILHAMPAHPAVHGFVKERSIRTFAEPHVGRRVVLRMDLKDFFPSFSGARIQAFFRTAGYPEPVSDLLGGICTNAAPSAIFKTLRANTRDVRDLYARPHLPQGAPTSPAIANLCAYRTDCRLSALARKAGAQYTRYADDLAFSGDDAFEKRVERFAARAAAVLLEEGFTVNFRKTRIMRQGVRQYLAGLVVNERVNSVRADFDRLKAILTNCVRYGPESQNRESHRDFRVHLAGRVGFVESINPAKGARLRRILDQIHWQ
jgi:RNA-directed DNA polymerase